jgi:hypothetical protein
MDQAGYRPSALPRAGAFAFVFVGFLIVIEPIGFVLLLLLMQIGLAPLAFKIMDVPSYLLGLGELRAVRTNAVLPIS